MTDEVELLERELKKIKEDQAREEKVKTLKRQIKTHKFSQTKGGKIFNVIGDFGLKVKKRILTPPPVRKGHKRKTVEEVMKSLPQ